MNVKCNNIIMLLKLKHEQQSSFVDNLIRVKWEQSVVENWCSVSERERERDDYNDDGAWNCRHDWWAVKLFVYIDNSKKIFCVWNLFKWAIITAIYGSYDSKSINIHWTDDDRGVVKFYGAHPH